MPYEVRYFEKDLFYGLNKERNEMQVLRWRYSIKAQWHFVFWTEPVQDSLNLHVSNFFGNISFGIGTQYRR